MCFICFRLSLQCNKLESVGHCLWGKLHHDAINFFRNLEIVFCAAFMLEASLWRFHRCQSKERFIFILMKTKHLIDIMMFGVVTSSGYIMPPFIFLHDLRLNMNTYIKCLEELVLPWIEKVAAGRPYVCQQDSALCYTSRRNPFWRSDNFSDHITRLPNSPDSNPFDY